MKVDQKSVDFSPYLVWRLFFCSWSWKTQEVDVGAWETHFSTICSTGWNKNRGTWMLPLPEMNGFAVWNFGDGRNSNWARMFLPGVGTSAEILPLYDQSATVLFLTLPPATLSHCLHRPSDSASAGLELDSAVLILVSGSRRQLDSASRPCWSVWSLATTGKMWSCCLSQQWAQCLNWWTFF